MKNLKKSVVSFMLAVCLIIPCVFMLSACGKDKTTEAPQPYAVAGKSWQGTSECVIVWKGGVTEQDKSDFFSRHEHDTEEEMLTAIKEGTGEGFCALLKLTFNNNGTVTTVFVLDGVEDEPNTIYYKQSEDLKTIELFKDAECTQKAVGDHYGPQRYEWKDGQYYAVLEWDELFDVYFVFKQA